MTRPGVDVDEVPFVPRGIEGVSTSIAAFVGPADAGPVDTPVRVRSTAEFEQAFAPTTESRPLALAVRLFFDNGGKDAVVVRPAGSAVPGTAAGGGLFALDAAADVNLICLPGLAEDASTADPSATAAALASASRYAAERRAVLLVDPPATWRAVSDVLTGPTSVRELTAAVELANAAAWFPRVVVETAAGPVEVGPSGAIAGIIARTDLTRGVWKPPAGPEASVTGIVGLGTNVGDDGTGALREAGVNALRTFPSRGTLSWGARTLDGALGSTSEWKYVNVRRMALFLEHSIDRGLEWAVSEPNDERLWAEVRRGVEAFLLGLFRSGAFAGATPREAYFVQCGRDTMTQNDIDSGVLNVLVGFAPAKPAEFVIVRIGRRLTPDEDP